jgi:hypothetical protein
MVTVMGDGGWRLWRWYGDGGGVINDNGGYLR